MMEFEFADEYLPTNCNDDDIAKQSDAWVHTNAIRTLLHFEQLSNASSNANDRSPSLSPYRFKLSPRNARPRNSSVFGVLDFARRRVHNLHAHNVQIKEQVVALYNKRVAVHTLNADELSVDDKMEIFQSVIKQLSESHHEIKHKLAVFHINAEIVSTLWNISPDLTLKKVFKLIEQAQMSEIEERKDLHKAGFISIVLEGQIKLVQKATNKELKLLQTSSILYDYDVYAHFESRSHRKRDELTANQVSVIQHKVLFLKNSCKVSIIYLPYNAFARLLRKKQSEILANITQRLREYVRLYQQAVHPHHHNHGVVLAAANKNALLRRHSALYPPNTEETEQQSQRRTMKETKASKPVAEKIKSENLQKANVTSRACMDRTLPRIPTHTKHPSCILTQITTQ